MQVTLPTIHQLIIQNRKRFVYSLIIAFIAHSMFFASIHFAPQEEVLDIPVKTLNIKLGGALSGEEEALLEQAMIPESNSQALESSLQDAFAADASDNTDNIAIEELRSQKQIPQDATKTQRLSGREGLLGSQAAKQYVRERAAPVNTLQAAGDVLGNTQQSAQTRVQAYTQTIALWLDKFKIYPEEAKAAGMQGRAMVRIRIDRRGNVHYRILTQKTAYPLLDKAVLDMVRRANPVPPVPADYPMVDQYLEFVIPVSFKLD